MHTTESLVEYAVKRQEEQRYLLDVPEVCVYAELDGFVFKDA
jgi:hypothetical protein